MSTRRRGCTITGVTSSEPDNGLGDGHVGPDSTMTGGLTANVRAGCAGNGPGRTSTLQASCTDASGKAASAATTVFVPYDGSRR